MAAKVLSATDLDRLRDRLRDMRDGLIERLAQRIDGGDLALLGSVGAALRAVDDIQREEHRDGTQY